MSQSADFSARAPFGDAPVRSQLARLHSTYGNQAMLRMLSQAAPTVQTKLAVNKPGDEFEQEADQVADQVMRMTSVPAPSIQRKCSGCDEEEKVQRKCAGCEEEEKQTGLQRKETGADPEFAPPSVHSVLNSPGHPLDTATRAFMEPRFGHDFSRVRVHTDASAADSARAVNARAYTAGPHIVFGEGQYSPATDNGRQLLSHELVHVVQQNTRSVGSTLQRFTINNCTKDQQLVITSAILQADDDLTAILLPMARRPVAENVKNALYLAFRDDSQETVDLVQKNLLILRSKLRGTHFTCVDATADKTCGLEGTLAYSPGGDPKGAVTFCRPAYFATDMSALAQSEVVTHEISHMYLNTEDRGYFAHVGKLCSETAQPAGYYNPKDRTPGTAGENPEVRLENADSYGCFVYYLSHPQAVDLKSTSASYKGEDLVIKPIEGSEPKLYTRPGTPELHRFGLLGEPANSGFQVRWWLQAGSKVYQMAARNEGVLYFSLIHREVYLPAESAGLLEKDKVTKATLYCEILPFSSWSAKFPQSVITRQLDLEIIVGPPPVDP